MAANRPYIGKETMTSQFADMTSTSNFFDVALFLLPSLVTGPSFMSRSYWFWSMTIFVYKGLVIWKSEIPRLSFAQYLETGGKYGVPKLCTNVSNKILLNAGKPFPSYQGETNRALKLSPPPPPRLVLKVIPKLLEHAVNNFFKSAD